MIQDDKIGMGYGRLVPDLDLRAGDIIVIWSSRLIAFMINAVFGISDPATHAEMVYDDQYNISASIGGVKLRPTADMFKARKWVVLRNNKILPPENVQWTAGRISDAAMIISSTSCGSCAFRSSFSL